MNWKFCFPLLPLLLTCTTINAQSLSVSLVGNPDTTGFSASEVQALERTVKFSFGTSGATSDTLVVELGPTAGSYDLLTRRFPLSETGTFVDGCWLNNSGGTVTVGLGNYTGLTTFHVRAYLASAGIGSAVLADND